MGSLHPDENSYLIDQESSVEMARLIDQDIVTTGLMGGIFPPDLPLASIHDVLDIACGPGGWVLETAFAHRDKQVTGIDISNGMLQYARAQAKVQNLSNVHFLFMDATSPLNFPDASFDFVNARFLVGFMWKEAWPALVRECVRITRPGGTIRLTDVDSPGINNSAALEQIGRLLARAFYRTGRSFCANEESGHFGLTPMFRIFFEQAGCIGVREQMHVLNYSAGIPLRESHVNDLRIGMGLVKPFFTKIGLATEKEYDRLYQQMLLDLVQEDFRGLWYFMSAWAKVPG